MIAGLGRLLGLLWRGISRLRQVLANLVFLALIPVMMFWSGAVPLPWMALGGAAAVAVYLVIVNPFYAAIFVALATAGMLVWTRSRGMAVLALNCSNVTLHGVNATGLSGQAAVVEGCEKRSFWRSFI